MTSAVLAGLYVTMLYMVPESVRELPRDHTAHVLARSCCVLVTCVLSLLPLFTLVSDGFENTSTWQLVGYGTACVQVHAAWLPVLAVFALFLGPTVHAGVAWLLGADAGRSKKNDDASVVGAVLGSFTVLNLRALVIAPASEEWVFRACVMPLFAMAGAGPALAIPATCATFALAHVHHYFEHVRAGASPGEAVQRVATQLAYTSLFGVYAGWVFWRTGSVIVTAVCHAVCNAYGLPDLSFLHRRSPAHAYRFLIALAYVLGVALFAHMLAGSGGWGGRDAFPCALAFGIPSRRELPLAGGTR